MAGSIRVSFAGTFKEAQAFAAEHEGINAPKGLATKGDDSGLPMLSAPYKNRRELAEQQSRLVALGWDREFQCVHPHGHGF